MKKNMIVGIAVMLGMLSAGAISASAAGPCCGTGKCSDKQTVRQFNLETAALAGAVKAKESELREQLLPDSINLRKMEALEAELKELKEQLRAAGVKSGVPSCCIV